MQKRGNAGGDFLARLQPIAALKHVCGAFFVPRLSFARDQGQRRRAFGPLFPERFDFFVRFFQFGNGRAPVTENGRDLRGRTFLARNFENVAHVLRQRIGNGIRVAAKRSDESGRDCGSDCRREFQPP